MGDEADSDGTPRESWSSSRWALRRAVALVAAAAVLIVLWVAVKPKLGDAGSESATSNSEPRSAVSKRTMYGCAIVPYEEAGEDSGDLFAGVTATEPFCTEVALLEERCGVPPDSLVVPPAEEAMEGALSRYYTSEDGSSAGSFLTYTGVGGPPGVVSTLICVDGSAIDFTEADWNRFNSPAAADDDPEDSSTSSAPPRGPDQAQVLPPASSAARVELCSEPLTETANGNADPIFCADGSLNEDAWTYLATNDPTLFQLGPDASFDEVTRAICTDRQVSTNSIADSTYRLAEAYYGWQFDDDPTEVMYAEEGCP